MIRFSNANGTRSSTGSDRAAETIFCSEGGSSPDCRDRGAKGWS
jgi:hypothetical protein